MSTGAGSRPRRTRPARRDRRRAYATVVLVAMVVATLGGAVLAIGGGGDGAGESDGTTTAPSTLDLAPTTSLDPSTLGPEGRELLGLVEAGRRATYHVAYAARSPELESVGASASLELWRRGAQVRQETVRIDAGERTRLVAVGGPAGTVSCEEQEGTLTCEQVSVEPLDPTDDVLATILALVPDGEVAVRDDTVTGIAARCFGVTTGDTEAELCLTADGVPLRIADGVVALEANLLDQAVTDETFVP